MRALNWIVLALALFQGGWLCFDGSHALLLGDYVTPRSGPGAGQLGPWARLVSAVGLDPRSTTIKCLHLFLGIAWLIGAVAFIVRPLFGSWLLLACAIATLWYLPIGTIISITLIALLLTRSFRA